ncbi:hypothetical protein ACNKXS_13570 [Christiangramia marina]|uniref:hypothetical protein n=1 Tax=Christiangramia marina TaxID=409436 RepID=UPI003AA853D6
MNKPPLDIEEFQLFPHEKTLFEKSNIPDSTGIYAWYINFSKFQNFSTKKEFLQNLKKINELISPDNLNGTVKSYFRKYKVMIDEDRPFIDKFYLEDEKEAIISGTKLESLTLAECKDLMNLLSNFSILVNPLYIGISNSLRRRWEDHRRAFFDVKKLIDDGENQDLIFQESQKSFGGRAAYQNFNWEYMIFACVEKDIDRKLVSHTEYLVNRLYNPLFGRK